MKIGRINEEGKARWVPDEQILCDCAEPNCEKSWLREWWDWLAQPRPKPEGDPGLFPEDRRGRGANANSSPGVLPGFRPPVFVP